MPFIEENQIYQLKVQGDAVRLIICHVSNISGITYVKAYVTPLNEMVTFQIDTFNYFYELVEDTP